MLVHSQISQTNKHSWLPYPIEEQQQLNSSISTSLPVIDNVLSQSFTRKPITPSFGSGTLLPRALSSTMKTGKPESENGLDKCHFITMSSPNSSSNLLELRKFCGTGSVDQSSYDLQYQPMEDSNHSELQSEVIRLTNIENECQKRLRRIEDLVKENIDLLMEKKKAVEELSEKSKEIQHLQSMVGKSTDKVHRRLFNAPNSSSDIAQERQESEKIRKDLQTSNQLVTTLQKDLINRDTTIRKLTKEVEHLKENISEKDVSVSSLMRNLTQLKEVQQQIQETEKEKADKNEELNSLDQKLQTAERNIQSKDEEIEYLTEMVEKLQSLDKKKGDSVRDLNLKLLDAKSMVGDLQVSEGVLRVAVQEIENKYRRLLCRVTEVTKTISESGEQHLPIEEDKLIQTISDLVNGKRDNDEMLSQRLKMQDAEICKLRRATDAIQDFTTQLKECLSHSADDRTSARMGVCSDILKAIPSDESIEPMRDLLIGYVSRDRDFLSNLESAVSHATSDWGHFSILEGIEKLKERYADTFLNQSKLEQQIESMSENYNIEMQRIKRELEVGIDAKASEEIEKERSQKRAMETEHQRMEGIIEGYESKLREYERIIADLERADHDKELQHKQVVDDLNEKIVGFGGIEEQMKRVVESRDILEHTMREQMDDTSRRCDAEVDGLKEEITRHRGTIMSLKNQIVQLSKENKNALLSMKKQREMNKSDRISDDSQNKKKSTVVDQERNLETLRDENVLLQHKNRDNEETIKRLMMDNTNYITEISSLKVESKKNRDEFANDVLKIETESIQSQPLLQLSIVDDLVKKLQDKTLENEDLMKQISRDKGKHQEDNVELLSGKCSCEKYTKLSTEFVTLGAQCRGDRHIEVIESQKTALGDLRRKMRKLDMGRFQEANSQHLTEHISKLMKDIAELKANEALKETMPQGERSIADILQERTVANQQPIFQPLVTEKWETLTTELAERTRENKKLAFDLELEKAACLDLKQSFQLSESSYIHLVRELSTAVDLKPGKSPETFGNLLYREKANLQLARDEVCEEIVQKITILKEMVERKDELLLSYERDLVRLKQVEDLSAMAHLQMAEMIQQTHRKVDEVDLLRETLIRTKDLLNIERRRNAAIKENKCHQSDLNLTPQMSQSDKDTQRCTAASVARKETEERISEKLRRKDYEIQCLKEELSNKNKVLVQALDRLNSIETTLGIQSEESVT